MSNTPTALLEQLRDVVEPAPPSWFPPPIGWYIVGLAILSIGAVILYLLLRDRTTQQTYAEIRTHALALSAQRREGVLSARAYADQINALLKRLLVHVEGRVDTVQTFGRMWLEQLQERFNHDGFVEGPGVALGAVRFMHHDLDDNGLPELIEQSLGRVTPPKN